MVATIEVFPQESKTCRIWTQIDILWSSLPNKNKLWYLHQTFNYKPTTSSDNPASLVHFSSELAEATKAFLEESASPDFTDTTKFNLLDTKKRGQSRYRNLI